MKKIINGKKYDTETAIKLAYWTKDKPNDDFYFEQETLYIKKNGEYFLSTWQGNKQKLFLMSDEGAKEWSEFRLDADEYEKLFGEVEE